MSWVSHLRFFQQRKHIRRSGANRRVARKKAVSRPLGLPEQHAFIASYPRSGNTWLSKMVADVLLQQNGHSTNTSLPINEREIIPDMDRDDLQECKFTHYAPYLLAKTHVNYSDWMNRGVFLFRQPTDVMVSCFHYHSRYPFLKPKTVDGLAAFCKNYIQQWYDHTHSFISACNNHPSEFLPVSYESLLEDTECQLRRVLGHFRIQSTEQQIKLAMSNHEFRKHSINEADRNAKEKPFRCGKKGSGRQAMDSKTYQWVNNVCFSLYRQAAEKMSDDRCD